MPDDFLATLANVYDTRNFEVALNQGQFSLLNRSAATVTSGNAVNLIDFRLKTNFQVIGRAKRVLLDDTFTDYSGYNKKFISDNGVFMPEAALSEFAKTDFGKRVITKDIEAKINSLPSRDCHVAFLYNMLISWARAVLYGYQKEEALDESTGLHLLKIKYSGYQDSHVVLDGIIPDEQVHIIELDDPVEQRAGLLRIRNADNYFDYPYVFHYDASTVAKESFYLVHASGRTKTSALNFDVPIPLFDLQHMLLDRVNSHTPSIIFDTTVIPYHKADLLWDWIIDYVRLNRVEQQFAAAFETLVASGFQPDPSTQEASSWLNARLNIVLSSFSPTRARIRATLSDEAYYEAPDSKNYVIDASIHSTSRFIHGAIHNYLMWYGLYALVHDEARSRSNWRSVFESTANNLSELYTPEMRAFCISNITGHEIPTYMTGGCGMYIDLSNMYTVTAIPVKIDKEGKDRKFIPIDAVYAPVSGSLLLGTYSGDFEVIQHLKSIFSFEGCGISTVYEDVELLKLTTIYRLCGHDITLREARTNKRNTPYANVHECIPEPASVFFDSKSIEVWHPEHNDPREGRTHAMPQLKYILDHNSISIVIQKPNIEPIVYRSATRPLDVSYQPKRRVRPVLVGKVLPKYTATTSKFRALCVDEKNQQDFRYDQTRVPPSKPEGRRVTEISATGQEEIIPEAGMTSSVAMGSGE
jgi:hypothetical protein